MLMCEESDVVGMNAVLDVSGGALACIHVDFSTHHLRFIAAGGCAVCSEKGCGKWETEQLI